MELNFLKKKFQCKITPMNPCLGVKNFPAKNYVYDYITFRNEKIAGWLIL